jgi:hypothetical protein
MLLEPFDEQKFSLARFSRVDIAASAWLLSSRISSRLTDHSLIYQSDSFKNVLQLDKIRKLQIEGV